MQLLFDHAVIMRTYYQRSTQGNLHLSDITIAIHLYLGDRKGSIPCINDKEREFLRVVIMSYKHKGFDNNAFELDVVDSPYGAKGMCNELSRFLFCETRGFYNLRK